MYKAFLFALVSSSLLSSSLLALEPVIYGKDGRLEVYEASPMIQKLAASAAVKVPVSLVTPNASNPSAVDLNQKNLTSFLEGSMKEILFSVDHGVGHADKEEDIFVDLQALLAREKDEIINISVCPEERFQTQPTAGTCSGFLIAPDLLVTAGHCVDSQEDCQNSVWVFDYKVDEKTQTAGVNIDYSNIYSCKKVTSHALIRPLNLDYAVVQLDRRVTGRTPLEFRTSGKIEDEREIFVVGAPSGLPLKVAGGARVRNNELLSRFSANLDTYGGNSGSGVFDAETGLVEGILVEGDTDYILDSTRMCIQSNQCEDDKCMGENATRITAIPEVAFYELFNEAAIEGKVSLLQKILVFNLWIDFYGKDGQSALMKAALNNQFAAVELLLEHKADPKLVDAAGNSIFHLMAENLTGEFELTLDALVKAGADLEAKNAKGETPLLVAARELNINAVRIFIEAGANKNALNEEGETVLFTFARAGQTKAYKTLLDLGVDPGIKNKKGYEAHSCIKFSKRIK